MLFRCVETSVKNESIFHKTNAILGLLVKCIELGDIYKKYFIFLRI